jgi:hypothetical protein
MYTQEPNPAAGLVLLIPWLFVIGSAIWVYVDAKSIGARKGLIPGFLDLGPVGWALCTLLFWILGFPLYLTQRGSIKQAARQRTNPQRYRPGPQAGWANAGWQTQGWAAEPAQRSAARQLVRRPPAPRLQPVVGRAPVDRTPNTQAVLGRVHAVCGCCIPGSAPSDSRERHDRVSGDS